MVWGHIMTESSSLTNFNFGFSTYKSDILIHLSQWQYWWWFWFSLFWGLYFFIISRVLNKRVAQFNPIINTSIRGHGKWGDFLVAIIPLSWCGNILVNSNFILRMIEWQNEASLFTLRVQGKQWYWVYKFDATAAQSILSAPKNVGHNNWLITNTNESYISNTYYSAISLGTQLEYKQLYFKLLSDDKLTKENIKTWTQLTNGVHFDNFYHEQLNSLYNYKLNSRQKILSDFITNDSSFLFFKSKAKTLGFYDFELLDDTSDFAANLIESVKNKPLTFMGGILNKHNIEILSKSTDLKKPLLFVCKFWNNTGTLESKVEDSELLWGFKQKKYKRLQKYKFLPVVKYDHTTLTPIQNTKSSPLTLKSAMLMDKLDTRLDDEDSLFDYQNTIKFNRHRGELVPVNLARRLLRTKRTLVLPAHVNITVVTNSYDVVHSWFIPGLGLKLDCVPGRSTHHSFYIDNVGFYYGQCAEICGRYHHHMPIRLCALPFEQFLVWWQRRGVRRLYRIGALHNKNYINPTDVKFRYSW